ncbi:uncharacterized protein LOC120422129 [Culex pipiens pallens]|uniref:uncharacterized protein LOC120422129 n=1 Tax=Culex pipiens pallens TaxID=42434 RepID=UPI001953FEA0|nr:uncharacterized protein LOC120422129 [Culex pipiens pallens]
MLRISAVATQKVTKHPAGSGTDNQLSIDRLPRCKPAAVREENGEMALIPIEQIGKPPSVPPTAANPSVVINTPSSTPPAVGFPLQNLITQGKRDYTGRILSTQCKENSEVLLNECGICAAPTIKSKLAVLRVRHIGQLRPRARDPAESPAQVPNPEQQGRHHRPVRHALARV